MQKYNAVTLVPNMPVKYITFDQTDTCALEGHFAFHDEHGTPYVFDGGGTSYTRGLQQTVKCKHVMVMTTNDQAVHNSNALLKTVALDNCVKIGDRDQHEISYSLCNKR